MDIDIEDKAEINKYVKFKCFVFKYFCLYTYIGRITVIKVLYIQFFTL